MKAIVIGGSVAGLSTALALSRSGHDVAIAERDANPLPPDPVAAFYAWQREGAPQVWHSHAFLARLRNVLRERAPDVYEELLAAGATEMRFGENLPPEFGTFVPQPGDDQLVMLASRRITFEWVLRRAVLALPHVSWRGGVTCVGLLAEPDAAAGVLGLPGRTELDSAHRKIAELERQLRRMQRRADDKADPVPAPAARAATPAAKAPPAKRGASPAKTAKRATATKAVKKTARKSSKKAAGNAVKKRKAAVKAKSKTKPGKRKTSTRRRLTKRR